MPLLAIKAAHSHRSRCSFVTVPSGSMQRHQGQCRDIRVNAETSGPMQRHQGQCRDIRANAETSELLQIRHRAISADSESSEPLQSHQSYCRAIAATLVMALQTNELPNDALGNVIRLGRKLIMSAFKIHTWWLCSLSIVTINFLQVYCVKGKSLDTIHTCTH